MFEFPSEFERGAETGNGRPVVQGVPHEPLGTLTSTAFGRQFSYQFTTEDVLWTARFLVGEAGGRDDLGNRAVLWAMFNRYALFTHRVYQTFQQFIRAYSTPLQPVLRNAGAARRHMNSPTFVRAVGNYPGTTVPRGQLRRHLELQSKPWDQLPASARSLAERALKGQVANPIGNASEFGSTYVYFHDRNGRYPNQEEWQRFTEAYALKKKWRWIGPVQGLNQRGNAFFVQRRAVNLPAGSVRVIQPGRSELFEAEWVTAGELAQTRGQADGPAAVRGCLETGKRAKAVIERGRRGRGFIRRREDHTRIHAALDVDAPIGTPVFAVLDGQVVFADKKDGFGNLLILYHARPPHTSVAGSVPVTTAYAHLSEMKVRKGDCVSAGQEIGKSGNTFKGPNGGTGGVTRGWVPRHLHFSIQLVRAERNRPRYFNPPSLRYPVSGPLNDITVDNANVFSSRYEEDWGRRINPVEWLRELGVAIATIPLPAPAASTARRPPVRQTVRPPAPTSESEFFANNFSLRPAYEGWQSALNRSGNTRSPQSNSPRSACECGSGCQQTGSPERIANAAVAFGASPSGAGLTREVSVRPRAPMGASHTVSAGQPPGSTLYERIPLGEEAPAKAKTGIFFPAAYQPRPQVDLIIYLHGMKEPSGLPRSATIDRYWSPPFPFLLREALNQSGKNAILVAPTLGPASEAGHLTKPGGLDWYVDQVMNILVQRGPYQRAAPPLQVGNIIIAGHSAGGKVLRALAQRANRYSANLREFWGFDCLYGKYDAAFWRQWSAAHPNAKLYIYFLNSTAGHSRDLQGNGSPRIPPPANVLVEHSSARSHNLVPKTHFTNLVKAAPFLRNK